ncbi:MAG: replication restart DNA helicase PriA [Synechococcales cyanobacterium CRU_2_2]|nr:replication restart DNA helicase PriA [Synechococcales cyanobacterium CRU_2_2]
MGQQTITAVHCPNCGSLAERIYSSSRRQTRTQCAHCDYLMVTGEGGDNLVRVVESYAPGIVSRSPVAVR